MYLFKTSGKTFKSVIINEKHAFPYMPQNWHPNELVLVSKNKSDCDNGEKQIQYTMILKDIRKVKSGEIEKYWPGNEGRWKYLIICEKTKLIKQPFDLKELLGEDSTSYRPIVNFRKVDSMHEIIIENYLQKTGTL